MRRVLAFAAVAAIAFSISPQASATPCCSIGWHWKRAANPFTVKVLSSLTSKYTTALQGATSDWSKSDKLDMVITQGDKSLATRKNCAATFHEVHICNANYGATGWAGLTEVTQNGPHIVRVRVRLNDAYVTAGFTRTVTCHELGHTLGLGHNTRSTSCMKQGTTRAHPDSIDYAELDRIYHHLDGAAPTTSDNTTRTTLFYDWVSAQ